MFKAPFSFNGRIGRVEYGLTCIIYIVFYVIQTLPFHVSRSVAGVVVETMSFIMSILMLLFLWAQGSKRCHDLSRGGWMQIVPFYIFALWFAAGDVGENEYDEDSKKSPSQLHDTLDGHLKN